MLGRARRSGRCHAGARRLLAPVVAQRPRALPGARAAGPRHAPCMNQIVADPTHWLIRTGHARPVRAGRLRVPAVPGGRVARRLRRRAPPRPAGRAGGLLPGRDRAVARARGKGAAPASDVAAMAHCDTPTARERRRAQRSLGVIAPWTRATRPRRSGSSRGCRRTSCRAVVPASAKRWSGPTARASC